MAHHPRAVVRGDLQEPCEDLGRRCVLAGEVGQRADDEERHTELVGDLRDGAALHLHGLAAMLLGKPMAHLARVHEHVARQDRADRDPWRSIANRRQLDAIQSVPDCADQVRGWREAELVSRVEERQVPGLIDVQSVGLEDSGVVLDQAVGNDDIAYPQVGVQSARDTCENDHARLGRQDERRCDHGGRDLADARFGKHNRLPSRDPVQPADPAPTRLPDGRSHASRSSSSSCGSAEMSPIGPAVGGHVLTIPLPFADVSEPTLDQRVRLSIFQRLADTARPPVVEELMAEFDLSRADAVASLARLAEARHVALVKGTARILMAFPFSAIATPFRVTAGREYFANCAWDAVAFHSMLNRDIRIDSFCHHCGEPIRIEMRDGAATLVEPAETIVYLALRPSQWWEDIITTCSNTMVFFSSPAHRDASDIAEASPDSSASLTPDEVHALGIPLYERKLSIDYARPSRDELNAHFASLGLTGPYWQV